jgi:hypothetical protein
VVKLIPPPSSIQDRAAYDYLYQLQEYLRVSLANLGSGIGGEDAASIGGGTTVIAGSPASAAKQSQYEALKALIIKTAEEVEAKTQFDLSGLRELINGLGELIEADEATLLAIQQNYLAQSDFGTYAESIAQQLNLLGDAIEQQVNVVSMLEANVDAVSADFNVWRMETEGYIRSGVVGYRDNGTPIIGIAIGQNLKIMTNANGQEMTETITDEAGNEVTYKVIAQDSFRAIYAADELSFWNGPVKVAFMNGNRLYITNVVALSSLQVGSWSVRDQGVSGLVFKWIGA